MKPINRKNTDFQAVFSNNITKMLSIETRQTLDSVRENVIHIRTLIRETVRADVWKESNDELG